MTAHQSPLDRGIFHQRRGELDSAIAEYQQEIARDGQAAVAYFNMAQALALQNRTGEAVAAILGAARLQPEDFVIARRAANILVKAGKLQEALPFFATALRIAPDDVDLAGRHVRALLGLGRRDEARAAARELAQGVSIKLAATLLGAGLSEDARPILEQCLARDPADARGAKFMLAAITGNIPDRASPDWLRNAYRGTAATWDLVPRDRGLRDPDLVADAVLARVQGPVDIVDLGCGTGHGAARLKPVARSLQGVDISLEMLERARSRGLYDGLHCGDLISYLQNGKRFDVAVSAAALIHFGRLDDVFAAANQALRSGGVFAFTLFPSSGADVDVHRTTDHGTVGLFNHGEAYIARAATAAGFVVEEMTGRISVTAPIEISVLLVVLRKP